MIVLGMDTSSKAAAVALYKDDNLIGDCVYNHGKTHSAFIAPMIKNMIDACGMTMGDIDVFACGVGPGSFTGVRIGITMAKTFALVQHKPCIGIDSLYALAYHNSDNNRLIIAIEDARRDRVFACGVDNGKMVIDTAVFTIDELCDRVAAYNKDVLFIGGGTRIYKDRIISHGFTVNENKLITGSCIISGAIPLIKEGKLESAVSLMPKYLLKSQAEQQKQ